MKIRILDTGIDINDADKAGSMYISDSMFNGISDGKPKQYCDSNRAGGTTRLAQMALAMGAKTAAEEISDFAFKPYDSSMGTIYSVLMFADAELCNFFQGKSFARTIDCVDRTKPEGMEYMIWDYSHYAYPIFLFKKNYANNLCTEEGIKEAILGLREFIYAFFEPPVGSDSENVDESEQYVLAVGREKIRKEGDQAFLEFCTAASCPQKLFKTSDGAKILIVSYQGDAHYTGTGLRPDWWWHERAPIVLRRNTTGDYQFVLRARSKKVAEQLLGPGGLENCSDALNAKFNAEFNVRGWNPSLTGGIISPKGIFVPSEQGIEIARIVAEHIDDWKKTTSAVKV